MVYRRVGRALNVSHRIGLGDGPMSITHYPSYRTIGGTSRLHNVNHIHEKPQQLGATTVLFRRPQDQNNIRTIHENIPSYVWVLRAHRYLRLEPSN